MNNILIEELNKIKNETNCSKRFRCISNLTRDNCRAKYHAKADLMECLESFPDCEHQKNFGTIFVCKCPLRKKIALHIEDI